MIELTPRERAVLEHAAEGESNVEIGRALIVSAETVKTYKRHLFEKLGARNTAHAVAIAFRKGLLQAPVFGRPFEAPAGDWTISGKIVDGALMLAFEPTEQG